MKKLASVILLASVLCLSAAGFAGCARDREQQDAPAAQDPNTVMLYDFEDFETGVEPLILLNYFGKVSLNTDAQYVRGGSGSLKMVVLASS